MAPTIAAVVRARYWTGATIRIAGALLVLWGMLEFMHQLLEWLPHLASFTGLSLAIMLWPLRWACIAIVLLAMQRRITAWLFPLPSIGCPQCGYPIAGRPLGACPECGLRLASHDAANDSSAGAVKHSDRSSPAPPGYPQ